MKPLRLNSHPDLRIQQLETLVDELIKDSPQEATLRSCMKAVGVAYSVDPVVRMHRVLEALEDAKARIKKRTIDYGRDL